MKFEFPKIASILYPFLNLSIGLIFLLPVASGELLNLSESIWIWGYSVILDTHTYETTSYTYDVVWGFSAAIKPLFFTGFILGGLFSTTVGQMTRSQNFSYKPQIIIWRVTRGLHMIGGILGFIAMMLFVNFINHLNKFSLIYKLGVLFYSVTIIFGLMIVIGFFAAISEINLFDPLRVSNPLDDIDNEEYHQLFDESTTDTEIIEVDDYVLESPALDEID